jgi:16S rRNA (uracil1498-N3)-methyltransferase
MLAPMADRYFVESPVDDASARLVGGEAHHLAHVMRAKAGDEVTLFDGSGAEFCARVKRIGRADVELDVVSRAEVDRELGVTVILGAALPKGDRARWLAEKATELGVARLVPLATEHGGDRPAPSALEKLRRAVIEASKQCGRNRLMEVAPPQALVEFFSGAGEAGLRLVAHPGGADCRPAVDEALSFDSQPPSVALAIGPEGGFTQAEIDAARARGWRTIDLGPRVLRVETAALALTALVVGRLDPRRGS